MSSSSIDPALPVNRVRDPEMARFPGEDVPLREGSRRGAFPGAAVVLTLLFASLVFVPPVRDNARLTWSILGIASGLLVWEVILAVVAKARGMQLRIEYYPVKAHYVQAAVQFSIMLYWGLYWERVYPELPLVLSQVLFLYTLDALFSWSRGRAWRLGYGPLPIVISTNLLLWFKHDWYYFQYLMLLTGALGKQFITWNRDGQRGHIFNPSAFGQALFAVWLIAFGLTNDLTWGREIATTFEAPYMLLVIFALGLVVQGLFRVTLMTVAGVMTLVAIDLVYTWFTGVYFFVSVSLAAPIFLGMHLLITDPATSPRTYLGRTLFGIFYALGYAALFRILDLAEVPLFWDKLLPVPILNLSVVAIDYVCRHGWTGRFNRAWETLLPARWMNLVHMSIWAVFFLTMVGSGYLNTLDHPGNSITFWKRAFAEGKPHAGHSLVITAGGQAVVSDSGAAYNELGLICMAGEIVDENHGAAARHFATACELGSLHGCANVAMQYLFLHEWRSEDDVRRALDRLEQECASEPDWAVCFLLGAAHETGRGRPLDMARAAELYARAGYENLYACKGLARVALSGEVPGLDIRQAVPALAWGVREGDAESAWYIAYMYDRGIALRQDTDKARAIMQHACTLGLADACAALQVAAFPPYENPVINVPSWATAYPLETPATATAADGDR